MAVIDPLRLIEQAEKLIAVRVGGPSEEDRRRAVSAAYYAIFHCVLRAVADQVVGTDLRDSPRYALVYRSVTHLSLRQLCADFAKPTLPKKYEPYVPANGFGPNLPRFATAFVDLYEKRHTADYDPLSFIKISDVRQLIKAARSAITAFQKVSPVRRRTFITLLLFRPRDPVKAS